MIRIVVRGNLDRAVRILRDKSEEVRGSAIRRDHFVPRGEARRRKSLAATRRRTRDAARELATW